MVTRLVKVGDYLRQRISYGSVVSLSSRLQLVVYMIRKGKQNISTFHITEFTFLASRTGRG